MATVAGGMVEALDEFEQNYRAFVERVNGYPMSEAARERILPDIEAIYRQERAADPPSTPPDDLGDTRR